MDEYFNRIFKKKKPEEVIRETQRILNQVIREIDREIKRVENEESKLIVQIKKTAKMNEMNAVKIMAKDLVRNRSCKNKHLIMKATIQGLIMKMTAAKSLNAMQNSMKVVTRTLSKINKQTDFPKIQKMLMDFQRETDIMEFKDELMNDALDDVLENDEEEDMDKIVDQVFDELGIEMNNKLNILDKNFDKFNNDSLLDSKHQPTPADTQAFNEDDLELRLQKLKKA